MSSDDFVILVIDRSEAEAENLKELIEFMDSPQVRTAMPDNWRVALGEERLEALFMGPQLSADDVERVVSGIGKLDPNVPIVMTHAVDAA